MGFTKDIIGTNESVGGINLFEKVQSTQPATPYTAGLMSATDKSKLDSLENYVHPDSGVRPGKYMQVEVNEQGHVTAGRSLQEGTLEDYGIIDAYIDLSDNSIVLGSHRIKPITPSDKVRWDQIINNPDTLAAYGIKDAEISDTGIIRLGEMTIKPLTAESTLSTAKLEGIIDKANLPDTLQELGLIDVAIDNGTINIGGDLITPLTADSQLAADKITGVIDLKNIPVGAMERCVVVEDDTARFALTTNDVQKGDTVKVINPTPTMYMVVDENKLDSADGYVVYSAGNANSVPWSGITDKPDHYYELPPADINTLGGVIVGDNISVDTDGKISTHPPYVLPQATNSTLGGVKIGENLSMQSDGTLNVPNATSTTAGVVKAGNNINIGADGTISGIAYNLPVATSSDLGGVKIGKNVETLGDGTLSVPVATNTKAGVVKAGTNINIDDDGTISTEKYQLPTATNMRLGGVRIGKYLSVDSEGLLNATGVPITASKTDLGGVIIGENIDIDENGKISVTLPTKTSELENDSEFITTENLSLLVNVYNNVAEMKQSTRLKVGMAAKTLGYYSANDGGGAYYVIRAKQDSDIDSPFTFLLNDNLIAELIYNKPINVNTVGAIGDGVTDCSPALAFCNNIDVYFPSGTYVLSDTFTTSKSIYGAGMDSAILKSTTDNYAIVLNGYGNINVKDFKLITNSNQSKGIVDNTHNYINIQNVNIDYYGTGNAIEIKPPYMVSRHAVLDTIKMIAYNNVIGSVGIYMENGADSRVLNIEIMGFQKGIQTINNTFIIDNVHIWCGNMGNITNAWWNNTRGIETIGTMNIVVGTLYLDTLNIGIAGTESIRANINNLLYWDDKTYPSDNPNYTYFLWTKNSKDVVLKINNMHIALTDKSKNMLRNLRNIHRMNNVNTSMTLRTNFTDTLFSYLPTVEKTRNTYQSSGYQLVALIVSSYYGMGNFKLVSSYYNTNFDIDIVRATTGFDTTGYQNLGYKLYMKVNSVHGNFFYCVKDISDEPNSYTHAIFIYQKTIDSMTTGDFYAMEANCFTTNMFLANIYDITNQDGKIYKLPVLDSTDGLTQITKMDTNNILLHKKYVACGDSFTYGYIPNYDDQNDLEIYSPEYNCNKSYAYWIAKRNSMNFVNMARNGYDMSNFMSIYKNIPTDCDYLTLAFGLNDYSRQIPIGNLTDIDTHKTFLGYWNTVLSWIYENIPNCHVGIIIMPAYMGNNYREAMEKVALKYGVPVLNLYTDNRVPMFMNKYGADEYIANARYDHFRGKEGDNHPSLECHKYMSTFIENWIRGL